MAAMPICATSTPSMPKGCRQLIDVLFAEGEQIYRHNGKEWKLQEPVAWLRSADGTVCGEHRFSADGNPYWRKGNEWVKGHKGSAKKSPAYEAGAVDHLEIQGLIGYGGGIGDAAVIQRWFTKGGAPQKSKTGGLQTVHYTASYYFWK